MKLLRPLTILLFLLLIVAAITFWSSRTSRVDMSEYAPADALVYVEVDSLSDVIKAFQTSTAWTTAATKLGVKSTAEGHWALVASRAGLAPTEAVLSSRAQIALVVVGLNTAEKDESLKVKPEVALIIETHTSKWRMKSVAVNNIKKLAEFAYGTSMCNERSGDVDYVECTDQSKSRKIIGAIEGTVVTIGNSDKAIQSCLEVRRGTRPSLHSDPELVRLKTSLKSNSTLSFGYVSQLNAARLISIVGPLLIGKAPGDQQLEQLLSNSASKILRGVAWTSTQASGGIDDRYQISLEPDVIRHLEPAFNTGGASEEFWKYIPNSFRSLTVYRNQDPQAAWSSLNSAVAMRLDTVSSVIFAALFKSSLSSYGIDDPKLVLGSLGAPLVTIRPAIGEGSLLIAKIKSEEQLKRALSNTPTQILTGITAAPDRNKEFAAVFSNDFVVLGKTEDMSIYLDQLKNNEVIKSERIQELKVSNPDASPIVTYTNERNSLTAIVKALALLQGRKLSASELDGVSAGLSKMEFSVVESTLSSDGIERKTHSAFGQFGSLLSFAQADSSESNR